MKLEDYLKADCSKFRTPPINISEYENDIEKVIVEAWRNGYDPNSTIHNLVHNSEVIGSMKNKIQESLDFQRRNVEEQVEQEKLKNLEAYGKDYQQKVEEAKKATEEAENITLKVAKEKEDIFYKESLAYNATQARLEEMRKSINEELEQFGGQEGYEALLEIEKEISKQSDDEIKDVNEYDDEKVSKQDLNSNKVKDYGPKNVSRIKQKKGIEGKVISKSKKNSLENKADYVTGTLNNEFEKKVDSVEKYVYELDNNQNIKIGVNDKEGVIEEIKKPYGYVKGFFKGIWRVLNYKIW